MSRAVVSVRDADPSDAGALHSIWQDFTTGVDRTRREGASIDQIERSIRRLETEPSERLLVAVVDDRPVGVAHLRRAPMSPIHDEDAVHVGYLHVLSEHRRRGVGKHLLEAAADWADDRDTLHIVASVAATARDANRFLARLGLSQVAVVRATSVVTLRAKLGTATPRAVTTVVAKRRQLRRLRSVV